MAEQNNQLWLGNFVRQAGVRRAIIVHGNVQDVGFEPATGEFRPIPDIVESALKRTGFQHVVRWDQANGMRNVSRELQDRLMRDATNQGEAEQQGEVYDMGTPPPSAPSSPARAMAALDFFSLVQRQLLVPNRERTAFVIDWSGYLFGNANSLSEAERHWLTLLSSSAAVPVERDSENLKRPSSLVVFICTRLGGIPPVFYQGNPAVTDIVVPAPGRPEREVFVLRNINRWNLEQPLQPGSMACNDFIDALDGLSLRDLQQLYKLSRQSETQLMPEALINLYKFGESKSPWEELSRDKLLQLIPTISKRVIGQNQAVDKVNQVIKRAFTGLSGIQHSKKQRMPKGTLFFVGPTGVGKTELAKALASFLFGDEEACIRFDMSEFNHEHSDQRLVGAPPGYVGYEEGGQLTNAVKRRPFSVLLFDEIEKADPRILDKFLQILEDGRLTDGKGETVSFAESVIIFTSNIGASEVPLAEDPAEVQEQFLKKVEEYFFQIKRPELLNRIGDNIVPFNYITSTDFLASIARAKLLPLRQRLEEKYGISGLEFKDEAKSIVAIAGLVDRKMGGRGVLNEIAKRIIDPLAAFIFEECDCPGVGRGRIIQIVQIGDTPQFLFQWKD